jgi:Zn-dependent protease
VVTFRLLGIPVKIESSAMWLAAIYVMFGLQARSSVAVTVGGILVTFGSILWHELGHAAAAQVFGLGPVDITLHGFGGLTRSRRADRPWKDLIVQLAGPIAGFGLGFVILAFAFVVPVNDAVGQIIDRGLFVNLFWSAFNLLPLFPLDGGQAMSSVLRIVLPAHAWNVTTVVGLVGGGLLGVAALAMMATGGGSAIFLLVIAGNVIQNNLALRNRVQELERNSRAS